MKKSESDRGENSNMNRSVEDIFTHAPKDMLPAVASLLRVSEGELAAALQRNHGRTARKVHVVRANSGQLSVTIKDEMKAGEQLAKLAQVLGHASGSYTLEELVNVVEELVHDHRAAVENARSEGMFEVSAVLGHDGDGDPLKYAEGHVEETGKWEEEVFAYNQAMQHLGVELPDEITVKSVTDAIRRVSRQNGYRAHSIALHQIDHVLRSETGPYPSDPWPDGAGTARVLTRAETAVEGLAASVAALGTMRSNDRIVVLWECDDEIAKSWLGERLFAHGFNDVVIVFSPDEACDACMEAKSEFIRVKSSLHGQVTHVWTRRKRVSLVEWLASVERHH